MPGTCEAGPPKAPGRRDHNSMDAQKLVMLGGWLIPQRQEGSTHSGHRSGEFLMIIITSVRGGCAGRVIAKKEERTFCF